MFGRYKELFLVKIDNMNMHFILHKMVKTHKIYSKCLGIAQGIFGFTKPYNSSPYRILSKY